jgi:HPt (histidine-containing phosphotransfer) domain-containing protein
MNPASDKETDPAEKLYDLSMISSISGGDAAFMKKMILLFNETVPANVRELVEATKTGNWAQVSKMAHKLKSTIDSMGIRSIHDEIRQVEHDARELENLGSLPSLVQQVNTVIQRCVQQLLAEVA